MDPLFQRHCYFNLAFNEMHLCSWCIDDDDDDDDDDLVLVIID